MKALKVCLVTMVITQLQLLFIWLTKKYNWLEGTWIITVPFFGIEAALVFIISTTSSFILMFSNQFRYGDVVSRNIKDAVVSIFLISVCSAVFNCLSLYGDTVCMFRDLSKKVPAAILPQCFIPLAKTITYFDSLAFPLILFRSTHIRNGLCL